MINILKGIVGLVCGCCFFSLLSYCNSQDQENKIIVLDDPSFIKIATNGPEDSVSKPHYRVFRKDVFDKGGFNARSIIGSFSEAGEFIVFKPLISFQKNVSFVVTEGENVIFEFIFRQATGSSFDITNVYPMVDTVPENLLKMYVEFNQPASPVFVYDHISLIENNTDTIDSPFVRLQPALWNTDYTRLTLWLDPGRIKRDLGPNQILGQVLREGAEYTLEISRDWKNQEGNPLVNKFKKRIYVTGADRNRPGVEDWSLDIPRIGTMEPITISFNEHIDVFLVKKMIQLINQEGKLVSVSLSPINEGTGAVIIPEKPWRETIYQLKVNALIEDLAGNNLNRLFDTDLNQADATIEDREFYFRRIIL